MSPQDDKPPGDGTPRVSHGADEAGFLKTGTYLHVYCPHCEADLLDERRVLLIMVGTDGERGEVRLSPRFNVFEKEATLELETGKEFGDLVCPRCERSLIERDVHCEWCDAHAVRFSVSAVHLDFHLFICARIGCHWHGLTEEDRKRISLDEPTARTDE